MKNYCVKHSISLTTTHYLYYHADFYDTIEKDRN